MKRFLAALAVALLAILAGAGCNDYGNTFQANTGAFLSFTSPSQVAAQSGQFTLTLMGSGFVLLTKVHWNGTTLATTVPVDSNGAALGTIVTAVVPANLINTPGVVTIVTVNPASGAGNNGLSNTLAFIINNPPNPVPTVTSVSPTTTVAGCSLSLTVNGTNFLNSSSDATQVSTLNFTLGQSQYQFTATSTPAASINSSQITVTIPAADLPSAGTATVSVTNPPSAPLAGVSGSSGSGGGSSLNNSSAPPTVTITPPNGPCPAAAKSQPTAAASASVVEETPAVSLDGRFVAYTALQNEHSQVLLRDTCAGVSSSCQPRSTVVSSAADGTAGDDDSRSPSMSSDGRFIAFSSAAGNLTENPPAGRQVYLYDSCAGAASSCKPSTTLISTDPNGTLLNAESILPSVSSSGRFVAFLAVTPSLSSNSSAPSSQSKSSSASANSGVRQVFVRDTCFGAANCTPKTTRISLQPGDGSGMPKPPGPALSGNAQHIALADAASATLFTRAVAVDDRVFLALASQPQ